MVNAKVATERQATTLNHSAAHLLHAALRQVLGSHVTQKGSSVDSERLRFDFSHFDALTKQELLAVEKIVNQEVRANLLVNTEIMPLEIAKKQGVLALFDEKYGEQVRVVSMGDFSKELCAGTHVKITGEIGLFKILSESSIAAGIRRIEAITGDKAFNYLERTEASLKEVAVLLKTDQNIVVEKLRQILDNQHLQEKELLQLQSKLANFECHELIDKAIEIKGIKVLTAKFSEVDNETMRNTVDQLRNKLCSSVIVLASVVNNKIQLIVGVSKDCVGKINACELLRYVAGQVDGKGGGRADLAQGGGTNTELLDIALRSVGDWVAKKI